MKRGLIIILAFVSLTLTNLASKVYAADFSKELYSKVQEALPNLDIRRTTINMATSAISDILPLLITNMTLDEIMKCATSTCPTLRTLYSVQTGHVPGTEGRAAGSLLGLAVILNQVQHEPMPVNLSYYINDKLSAVPFLDRAYAAQPDTYTPLIGAIYDFWKAFRNLAYGMIAIIMLVIGIMIMNRTKLNQQAVVTVQYALPQVVMAIIAITFSYPIGATILSAGTNFAWSIDKITDTMLTGKMAAAGAALQQSGGVVGILTEVVNNVRNSAGIGFISALIAIIGMLLVLLPYIWALIKALIIYIKLIIKIIYAPLIFAYGVIPGNDDKMVGWLKEMAAGALSLVGIMATLRIGLLVTEYVLQQANVVGPGDVFSFPAAVAPLVIPFILAAACYAAVQVPSMIDNAIIGPPPKKR